VLCRVVAESATGLADASWAENSLTAGFVRHREIAAVLVNVEDVRTVRCEGGRLVSCRDIQLALGHKSIVPRRTHSILTCPWSRPDPNCPSHAPEGAFLVATGLLLFPRSSRKADGSDEKVLVRVRRRQCKANDTVPMMHAQAQRHLRRDPKMRIINVLSRRTISEIKLKRTDTTLDLSQKAKTV
jgi:hypothetical protein